MYEKDSIIKLIEDKAKLTDFLSNKQNSIYWNIYFNFQKEINDTYLSDEFDLSKLPDERKSEIYFDLLLSEEYNDIIKPNLKINIAKDEIYAFLALHNMLLISTEFASKIYVEIKKVPFIKIKTALNLNKNKVQFNSNQFKLSDEIQEALKLADDLKNLKKSTRSYLTAKRVLLIDNLKNVFEGFYKDICIYLAYFYSDQKELSYLKSLPVGHLFDQYVNKTNIPLIFDRLKNKKFAIIRNAVSHHSVSQQRVFIDFRNQIYKFKDTKDTKSVSAKEFGELLRIINDYRLILGASMSLIYILSFCEDKSLLDFEKFKGF